MIFWKKIGFHIKASVDCKLFPTLTVSMKISILCIWAAPTPLRLDAPWLPSCPTKNNGKREKKKTAKVFFFQKALKKLSFFYLLVPLKSEVFCVVSSWCYWFLRFFGGGPGKTYRFLHFPHPWTQPHLDLPHHLSWRFLTWPKSQSTLVAVGLNPKHIGKTSGFCEV